MPMAISDVAPIAFWQHGNPADPGRNFRVAILAEGFIPSEMDVFRHRCDEIAKALFTIEPFARYRDRIAIIRIECNSFETATQLHTRTPPPPGYLGRTPFDATFGLHFDTEITGSQRAVDAVIRSLTHLPPIDSRMVIVHNLNNAGTQDGSAAWVTVGTEPFAGVFAHELGHLFGLLDEYEELTETNPPHARRFQGAEPSVPNNTRARTLQTIKWRDFITQPVAIPTTEPSPDGGCVADKAVVTTEPPVHPRTVGLFEGAGTFSCGIYRPRFTCRMRNEADDFCPVCEREITRRLDNALAAAPAVSRPDEEWTHVVQLAPDVSAHGSAFFFAACYNSASGRFGIYHLGDLSIDDPGLRSANHALIEPGFTSVVSMKQGDAHYLLLTSTLTDRRMAYRVRPTIDQTVDAVLEEVYRSGEPPRPGFSHLVSYDLDGWKYALHYDRVTGAIEMDTIRIEQGLFVVSVAGSSRLGSLAPWHAALSNIAVLQIAGRPHLVGIDAQGLRLYMAAIAHPLGNPPFTALTDTWFARPEFARGFQTHIAGVTVRDRPRLLMYSTVDGRAKLFRPRRAGAGLDFEFAAQLAPGAPSMFDAGFPSVGVVPSAVQFGSAPRDDLVWQYNFALRRFQAIRLK